MDISRILELDKIARGKVKEARKQAEEIDRQTPEKIRLVRDTIERDAKKAIETFEQQQNQMAEERIRQATAKENELLARLNRQYEQNADRWVAHIVSRVTEG